MVFVQLLPFLLAWVGHGYLLMLSLNVAYSQPVHRKILKVMRLTWGLLLVAGPPAFGLLVGFDLMALRDLSIESTPYLLPFVYTRVCWLAGIAFLTVTTVRVFRRWPAVVLDERTETVDVAKDVGHRPVGDGKYRRVAALGINDLFRVDFTTLSLTVPGLPAAWDGLTILHLSDL